MSVDIAELDTAAGGEIIQCIRADIIASASGVPNDLRVGIDSQLYLQQPQPLDE